MHFLKFLIAFSFVSVQIYSFPGHFNKCEEICSGHLPNSSAQLYQDCQTGCQFFYKIDATLGEKSNATRRECYSACTNDIDDEKGDSIACILGCDAVYMMYQENFVPFSSPVISGMDTVEYEGENDDFPDMQENHVIGPTTGSSAKTTEQNYRQIFYDEYAYLQYTSLIQLSIFCIVLIALIISSVKIIILIFQLKAAASKKYNMVDSSAGTEMSRMIPKRSAKHNLLR